MNPPPFIEQESEESCLPACLRMMLAHWGVAVDEAALRECCQTTWFGSRLEDVVACAQTHGLQAELREGAAWADLLGWLAQGYFPIVTLNLLPLAGRVAMHAVIVIVATQRRVTYLDPELGQRRAARKALEQAWQMRGGRALLLARPLHDDE